MTPSLKEILCILMCTVTMNRQQNSEVVSFCFKTKPHSIDRFECLYVTIKLRNYLSLVLIKKYK